MTRSWFSIFILCCFYSFTSYAVPAPYPQFAFHSQDTNYYRLDQEQYSLIIAKEYRKYLFQIDFKIKQYLLGLSRFHRTPMDFKPVVILTSSQVQRSGGYAIRSPFDQNIIYSNGLKNINLRGEASWLNNVLIHELSHLFQNQTRFLPSFFQDLTGTPLGFLLFAFSVQLNRYLPPLFLEGDSQFKELLLDAGGGLHTGFFRALAFSQIKFYQDDLDHFIQRILINNDFKPHSKIEKYIHGGLLFASLSEKYSIEAINRFFDNYTMPSIFKITSFDQALKKTFNLDTRQFFQSYIDYYLKRAQKQQVSTEVAIFKSGTCLPFNKDKGLVFSLVSDLKTKPSLFIYNTKLNTWETKKADLPLGKVFHMKGRYFSRASHYTKPHTIEYSLFSKGFYPIPSLNSKFVQDIQSTHILQIDAKDTINGYRLYLDKEYYDTINSNALWAPNGDVYYFKQKNKQRVLYKNKKILTSFRGFDSHLIEINQDGDVFFIAPSEYGSSVYQFSRGKIKRVTASDTIIEAKLLDNQKLLVCEVTHEGYDYKVISLTPTEGMPFFYQYPIQREMKEAIDSDLKMPLISSKEDMITSKDYKMNPLLNMKLSGIYMSANISLNSPWITSNNSFIITDPLQHNFIKSFFSLSLDKTIEEISVLYGNRISKLNWSLGYKYSYLPQTDREKIASEAPEYAHDLNFNLSSVLNQRGHWVSAVSLQNQFLLASDENFLQSSVIWDIRYDRHYLLEDLSEPELHASLHMSGEYSLTNKKWTGFIGGHVQGAIDVHSLFYIIPSLSLKHSIGKPYFQFLQPYDFNGMRLNNQLNFFEQVESIIDEMSRPMLYLEAHTILSVSSVFKKVFYTPLFFKHYPLSLAYIIPSIEFNYAITRNLKNFRINTSLSSEDNKNNQSFFEWKISLESQWIAFYDNYVSLTLDFGRSIPIQYHIQERDSLVTPSYYGFSIKKAI